MDNTQSGAGTLGTGRLNKAQRSAFYGAFIGWIFDYYEVFLLSMLAIPLRSAFHLSTFQVGLLSSFQLLFLAVGGVSFGVLADRIGRKKVLTLTVVIYSIGTMARAIAPDYVTLLILTCVAALGIGGEYGVGQTLVAEMIPGKRRGMWSGFLYGGIYIGIVLGSLVGGYLAPAIGWRWTFALSGLPVLLALWVRSRAPESDVWLNRHAEPARLRARTEVNARLVRVWLLCLVAASLQFFAYYGMATLLPTYLVSKGWTIASASSWLIFSAVAGAIGCVIGSWLTDKIGRRGSLCVVAGSACVGGMVLAAAWSHLLSGTWILIPFFILFAGSNGAAVFGSLFSELFPSSIRATAVSSALQVGRGMSFFPPLIAAALLPTLGYQPVVFLSAALFGVLALISWAFRETNGRQLGALESQTTGAGAAASAEKGLS